MPSCSSSSIGLVAAGDWRLQLLVHLLLVHAGSLVVLQSWGTVLGLSDW
jgi:hypothetical protein